MHRLSLLARFAAASILLTALLGVVLGQVLAGMIDRRALASASAAAELTTVVGIQPLLEGVDLRSGLPPATRVELDRALRAGRGDNEIARVKIWADDASLVYTHDPHTAAPPVEPGAGTASHELEDALAGHLEAELITGSDEEGNAALLRRYGALLEVYVPIRYAGSDRPVGAFELYLPYEPVARSIAADQRLTYAVLAGGLLLLWLGLFRLVASASRRQRRQAEHNRHQALHDALTGLPNRVLLRDRLEQAIRVSDRSLAPVALVVLDLDRFQEVNDTLGHQRGDDLIRQVGERLRDSARGADTVARLGGDEFAVLLTSVDGAAGALAAAERLRSALRSAVDLDGLAVTVEASLGVAMYPGDAGSADELLRHADIAMYVAKRSHSALSLYDPEQDHHSTERLELLTELSAAIPAGELVLHYQPKIHLTSGAVVGVEALVRWQHPRHGLLAPADFVPIAERTGLIHPLTEEVLRIALRQARIWLEGGRPTQVVVNVSTRSLLDLGFADLVLRLVSEYDVPPNLLGLEITETTIMDDPARSMTVLGRLHEGGIRLAVDDFGTGYSSLAYLKRLPVDELKVDRSFVASMTSSERDRVIVESTVALGRSLGLDVVAEGVEDDATRLALQDLGCDLAQGFLFSRPTEPPVLPEWALPVSR